MSPDGMKLGVSRVIADDGVSVTPDTVLDQLRKAGVTLDPDMAAVAKLVQRIRSGEDFSRLVVVRGQPPQEPRDAALIPQGDLDFPVFPGDLFLTHDAARKPAPGRTIDDKALQPTEKRTPKNLEFHVGPNCAFNSATGGFVSEVFGIARISEDYEISVAPLLHVSKDAVRVRGTVYSRDFRKNELTAEHFAEELRRLGVVLPPMTKRIEDALIKADKQGAPEPDVLVCKGKDPRDGKDGWIEYLVQTVSSVGAATSDGRVDYRERGTYPAVKTGEYILRVHPPEPGEGGIDIYDKTIPAREGQSVRLAAGEGVSVNAEGDLFQATADGIVVVAHNTATVTNCLIINGDVTLTTGHVRTETGSVKIKGNVRSGFTVSSPVHVVVDKVIEDAVVESGLDIDIGGGILMDENGSITAGGNVTAQFANNARITSSGTVTINNEVINCRIRAERMVSLKGKGMIQGGEITVRWGLECNELGSDIGANTTILVDAPKIVDKAKLEERNAVKAELDKINRALGPDTPEAILERTPPAKRATLAKILQFRARQTSRLEELTRRITEETDRRSRDLERVKIVAHKTIHPGVVVKIAGRVYAVERPLTRSTLYWSATTREIVVGSI